MASGNNQSNNVRDVPLTNISVTGNSARDRDEKNANSLASGTSNSERDAADRLIMPPFDPVANMAIDPTVPEGFNAYRNKKTLTQGLMDIALFSANANQLRYILEHGSHSQAYFYIAASLIIISLVLQIVVGLLLVIGTQYSVSVECQRQMAYKYGNYVVISIFLITIVNIFLAAFGGPTYVASPSVPIIPNAATAT